MESKIKCPKCGQMEKTKNGFHRGEQRYKYKFCGCNYTGGGNGYPDHVMMEIITNSHLCHAIKKKIKILISPLEKTSIGKIIYIGLMSVLGVIYTNWI